jgi:hypothetical protein
MIGSAGVPSVRAGTAVGSAVGATVGAMVGAVVGATVGATVGAVVAAGGFVGCCCTAVGWAAGAGAHADRSRAATINEANRVWSRRVIFMAFSFSLSFCGAKSEAGSLHGVQARLVASAWLTSFWFRLLSWSLRAMITSFASTGKRPPERSAPPTCPSAPKREHGTTDPEFEVLDKRTAFRRLQPRVSGAETCINVPGAGESPDAPEHAAATSAR